MTEITADFDTVTKYVADVFSIENLTLGGKQQGYYAKYFGMLKSDSEQAHARLYEKLAPHHLIPVFRWDGDHQVITIIHSPFVEHNAPPSHTLPSPPKVKHPKPWVNLLLFVATFISVLFAGALYTAEIDPFIQPLSFMRIMHFLWQGWPFAISFIAILTAHEFGHYLMGRHHKVNVTLPFFIPMPFSLVGTMGAFINMQDIPRNRKQLLDIGVAGPLAGLIIAIPVLIFGLSLSTLDVIPAVIPESSAFQIEGNSILYLLAKYAVFGEWLPKPIDYAGLSPFLYWLRYFFTGRPLPLGGLDVMIHPVAWAGWVGLLVTMLNLIPAGQFDGGHVFYVLFGSKAARAIKPIIIVLLVLLGFSWSGWWLWAALVFLMGGRHAEPLDQITPLDQKRKLIAILVLIIFLLIFMPVPLMIVSG